MLDGLIEAATRGVGAVALVEGPPGIGKTSSPSPLAKRAEAAGMETIAGRAGALERDIAWGVVRGLLGPALTRRSERERADLLAGAARLAAPIVGQGGEEDAALLAPRTSARRFTASTGSPRTSRSGARCSPWWMTLTGPIWRRFAGSPTWRAGSRSCRSCCSWLRAQASPAWTWVVIVELAVEPAAGSCVPAR